ncbi:MAG: thiamine pyrophosphate-dependent dehydrogenase E1 component subunit alpha [Bacillota bacterium]
MVFNTWGISDEVLIYLYIDMLKIRKIEQKIAELYFQNEMKTPVHLCIGQEAVAAGVCACLKAGDTVFSNHRGHGHYIAKGGDLKAMIAELYNKDTGCSRGRGGSMHLIDIESGFPGSSSIVGGCIPLAAGAALGAALQKNGAVSVAFFGDGAVEEGVFYESLNFAKLKELPVVFVCENNLYAVCSPLNNRQPNDEIYRRGEPFFIPGYRVDGNNVIEVFNAANRAITDARIGKGPSLLECKTYRLSDHHGGGTGVELGYRTQEELDIWEKRCPVKSFESFLVDRSMLTPGGIGVICEMIDMEIKDAFQFARESPLPDKDEIYMGLYL